MKFQNLSKSYVVETGSNSYGYYRKYSDDFVEQWGEITNSDSNNIKVTFPIAFKKNNSFLITFSPVSNTNATSSDGLDRIKSKTNTYVICSSGSIGIKTIIWYACGY